MNKTITKLKCTALAAAAISAFCAIPAFAQLNYRATSATNVLTTYTDLGTTGTAITVANTDDANSAATPIGFTFNYNGQAFTNFILNTNGFIKLGATAPATAVIAFDTDIFTVTDQNIIAPAAGVDLKGATNQITNPTEFRVSTTGTAPNRVTTIQWENLEDKATPLATANAQFSAIQFQVKLYETTNVIEFVYGTWASNAAVPTSGQPFLIGLKGSSSAIADRLVVAKPSSATPWTGTNVSFTAGTAVDPPYHFIRNTFGPDAGRTYRFTPVVIPANDAEVVSVFNLGKVPLKLSLNTDVITARIRNNGSTAFTNLPVTLTITGANASTQTVTIPTLAIGAAVNVNFTFAPTTAGTSNIAVSIPTDNVPANNQLTSASEVTPATISYVSTGGSDDGVGFGPTGNAAFLVRLKATGPTPVNITTVRAYIDGGTATSGPNTVGKTVYGVVVDSLGNLIGRSPDYVIQTGDLDNFKDFQITTTPTSGVAPVIINSAFYIGLAQPTYTGAQYFPMGFQNEVPQRPRAYYTWGLAAATPTKPAQINQGFRFMLDAVVAGTTLGVKEEINNAAVSVYPNPSKGVFNVSAKDMKGDNLSLEVRDLTGKLVYSAKASNADTTVDLKNVASGVYMLKVSSESQTAVKRLIVE
jgi:hypothetical protein